MLLPEYLFIYKKVHLYVEATTINALYIYSGQEKKNLRIVAVIDLKCETWHKSAVEADIELAVIPDDDGRTDGRKK